MLCFQFFQGKVYCQTSKGMKPVNISFPFDPDIDHKARLTDPNKAKRVDSNTGKLANSPNKEIQDDVSYDEQVPCAIFMYFFIFRVNHIL